MSYSDVIAVVTRFNDCINDRDIDALSSMMTDNHVFIDAADNRIEGKPACVQAWTSFFAAFPDYRNHFSALTERDGLVVIQGCSTCSVDALSGPALWTAWVEGEAVNEWRVMERTEANLRQLGLKYPEAPAP